MLINDWRLRNEQNFGTTVAAHMGKDAVVKGKAMMVAERKRRHLLSSKSSPGAGNQLARRLLARKEKSDAR